MNIFKSLEQLVQVEQKYTRRILEKLMVVERDKLYADLKYPSLHRYLIKGLGYSEAEATLRVNVVRLMNKSQNAKDKVLTGKISLVNACEANKASQSLGNDPVKTEELVDLGAESSTRKFKEITREKLGMERRETLVLKEYMLEKFDRLRKKYGDLSTYELLEIILEKELKKPEAPKRDRSAGKVHSRYISRAVKAAVYTGKCANCGVRHGLEYDHVRKLSHGGRSTADNLQMLCRNCNQRKEIRVRRSSIAQ